MVQPRNRDPRRSLCDASQELLEQSREIRARSRDVCRRARQVLERIETAAREQGRPAKRLIPDLGPKT